VREVFIAPQNSSGKGRTFEAICLASLEADYIWPEGMTATDNRRPVWAMFCGSENELRPFMVNLTLGRKANITTESRSYSKKAERFEFLKSARYQTTWQRYEEGCIATVFLPDLFRLDPGMVDPKGISFMMLPSREWVQQQTIDAKPIVAHCREILKTPLTEEQLLDLVPVAYLFAAYLDRRTRCPLLADGRFYLQLLLKCLETGLASWAGLDRYSYSRDPMDPDSWGRSVKMVEVDTKEVGLLPAIGYKSDHKQIEELLAEQVTLFFKNVK
jgi:hypothetical protein